MRNYLNSDWRWYLVRPWRFVRDFYMEAHDFVQRGFRGYADSDLWSFDWYLRRVLAKGLKQFAKNPMGYPNYGKANTPKKWKGILTRMANGFQAAIDEDNSYTYTAQQVKVAYQKQKKSLKLLAEWFDHLWD